MIVQYQHTGLHGEVALPSSKSLSNRWLIIQHLSHVPCTISKLSQANDTVLLEQLLTQWKQSNHKPLILDAQDAGTVLRFLLAVAAASEGMEITLTGTDRLCERPVKDLVDALRFLGASITYLQKEGFPPLQVHGRQLNAKQVQIPANVSSQFISALCLIAPTLPQGLRIDLKSTTVSSPYIDMTLGTMRQAGIISCRQNQSILIPAQPYRMHETTVESDWSSASFFYAMAILSTDIDLLLLGLQEESLQGDAAVKEWASAFGVSSVSEQGGIRLRRRKEPKEPQSIHLDALAYPDMVIPLIVVCGLKYPTCRFSGLHHLEYKESRRLSALQREMERVGILLHYHNDVLRFEHRAGALSMSEVHFHTYHDHRIAMSLALVSMLGIAVSLDDTACVKKSFPDYWKALSNLGFEMQDRD